MLFYPAWAVLGLRDAEQLDRQDRVMFGRGITVWMIAAGCLAFAMGGFTFSQGTLNTSIASVASDQINYLLGQRASLSLASLWIGVGGMVTALLTGLLAFGSQIRVGAKNEDFFKALFMVALIMVWLAALVLRVFMASELPVIGT